MNDDTAGLNPVRPGRRSWAAPRVDRLRGQLAEVGARVRTEGDLLNS